MSIGTGMFKLLHKYPFCVKNLSVLTFVSDYFQTHLRARGVGPYGAFKLQFPLQLRLRFLNPDPNPEPYDTLTLRPGGV